MPSLSPRQDRFERNLIINGNFDFWQRGDSVSGASVYGSDRWLGNSAQDSQNKTTRTTSTNMPEGSKYVNKFVSTGSAGAGITQRIEAINTESLRGKTVTFHFKAAMFSGSTDIRVTVNKADAVDDYSTSTQVYNSGVLGVPNAEASGYSSFKYSFLVTNDMATNGFQVSIVGDAASAWQIYLSQVMLNEGEVAGSFSRAGRTIAEELALCQRYYEIGYAFNGGFADSTSLLVSGQTYYKVSKRTIPTINGASVSDIVWSQATIFDSGLAYNATLNSNLNGFAIRTNNPNSRGAGSSGVMGYNFKANAEL